VPIDPYRPAPGPRLAQRASATGVPYVITVVSNEWGLRRGVPVACIHTRPGAPQFYIDPDVCIDCEQCEIVRPVTRSSRMSTSLPSTRFHRRQRALLPETSGIAGHARDRLADVYRAHEYARRVGSRTAAWSTKQRCPSPSDGWTRRLADDRAPVSKAYYGAAFHVATADLVAQPASPG